jgi:triphosphoribosyl-dephospho-CoA synthase
MTAVQLAQVACLWEAMARKPGNVHPGASFADVEFSHFAVSAVSLEWIGVTIGETILRAVQATQAAVGTNTNLGIILLLAPLVKTARYASNWRAELKRYLKVTSLGDAQQVYRAIQLAAPGGLGEVNEQDVRTSPSVKLHEAMALAADRDQIARQYTTGFEDVFDFGVPALLEGFDHFRRVEAATIECHLKLLAHFPDTLIQRKRDRVAAEDVQARARGVLALGGLRTREGRTAGREFDTFLRSQGHQLNPGTTADLVAACLFVALNQQSLAPGAPFRWNEPEWL